MTEFSISTAAVPGLYEGARNRAVCPICGKTFYFTGGWVYRVKRNHDEIRFCRYNCMRAWQKEKEAKRKKKLEAGWKPYVRPDVLTDAEKAEIVRLREAGQTFRQIGATIHRSDNVCGRYYRKYKGITPDE